MVTHRFNIGMSQEAKEIREEVFCAEQGYVEEIDEFDKTAVSLVLFMDDYPIATGRLIKLNPALYQAGRVAVRKDYRHKKVGSYVMMFLEEKVKELGGNRILVHSQYDKQEFYRKLGYVEDGPAEIDYEEGQPHIYLYKDLK